MGQENILWQDRKRTLFGLPWSFTKYKLTNERLFVEVGFFSKREDEVRLYRITDLSLERSLWQRIFGVGEIHCASGDKTMGNFTLKGVKKPVEIKELLSTTVEEIRQKKRVSGREFISDDGDTGEYL